MQTSFGRIAAAISLVFVGADAVHAGGVVGTGTPESCTEAAFDAALVGFGEVTFDCGAAPHTIIFRSTKSIPADAEADIDGGGLITLSGNNSTSFFTVDAGATLILTGLTLTRGSGGLVGFGAIQNTGHLIIQDSRVENTASAGEENGAITNYGTLTVLATTFAGNTSEYHGGAIFSYGTVDIAESSFVQNSASLGAGGAIYGSLSAIIFIEDSEFFGNFAKLGGGAVVFAGLGTVTNSAFVNNYAEGDVNPLAPDSYGGAVLVASTADIDISESRFANNEAQAGVGGAIHVASGGKLEVDRSTFSLNEADYGAAINNVGLAFISKSTFDGNVVAGGGAALSQGLAASDATRMDLEDSTVSDNEAPQQGAIAAYSGALGIDFSTVTGNAGGGVYVTSLATRFFANSIFAYNTPSDCDLELDDSPGSLGFNVSSDDSCQLSELSDDPSTDPLLAPLEDNGGPTLTRLPDPLSPAIDSGQCFDRTDQRGVPRPQGAACDRGAVERLAVEPPTTTTSSTTTTTTLPGETSCGDPVALVVSRDTGFSADAITASDALAVLNAAVGLFACELCVCDVDGSGSIAATDALNTLRQAVGLGGVLDCPACP